MGEYKKYPTRAMEENIDGEASGNLTGECVNGWHLSTDIGCAFMSLDALSKAYRDLKIDGLKELIEEMIEAYTRINFIDESIQTHATLSACRGIITMYQVTKKYKYLDIAINIFNTYIKEGMTGNFANYNWFGRPDWTEPCAIVDSFMVASELFSETENIKYLEFANKIYYNALGHAQRINGGFGCDNCVGVSSPHINVSKEISANSIDAYWCCTMRGSEGLAEVALALGKVKDDILHIGIYNPCEFDLEGSIVEIKTKYPLDNLVEIVIKGNLKDNKIALFLPSYTENKFQLTVNGKTRGGKINNQFLYVDLEGEFNIISLLLDIPLLVEKPVGIYNMKNYSTVSYGFLMLGVVTDEEVNINFNEIKKVDDKFVCGDLALIPINQTYKIDVEETIKRKLQVMFKND